MAPFLRSNPYQQLLGTALERQGWRVRMATGPDGPLALTRAWRAAGRPAVVHLHWTHPYLGRGEPGIDPLRAALLVAQLQALRLVGVRIAWTLHNLSAHDRPGGRLEQRIHREVVHRSDVVIAHCAAAIDLAVDRYQLSGHDRRRFRMIPHGSLADWYRPIPGRAEARRRLGLPEDAIVLLSLGRIRPYKGLPELLEAFRATPEPAARLVIAGAPEEDRVPADLLAAAARDPRVVLRAEHLSANVVAALLGGADAAVLPYRDVLTSGSAALAMGAGLPVIAPAIGCLAEQVPDGTGLLYDPADHGALAVTLRGALEADLATMGRRAAASLASMGWDDIALATIDAYAGARPPGRSVQTVQPGSGVPESGA